jgi:HK97 family phage prohead protease
MPMKPGKDESQSEFTSRCVPEMMGDGKRDQEQAVAICLQIWRDEKGGKKPKDDTPALTKQNAPEPEDGEDHDEFINRCASEMLDDNPDLDEDDAVESCELQWEDYSSRAAKPPQHLSRAEYIHGVAPVLHKTHSGTVQGLEFILSDETPDRMNDVISAEGWDITNFKRNPIALWNHSAMHPIGRWTNIRVDGGALRGHLELAPKGASSRIDEIRALIDAGILQAVSVGFRPLESKPRKSADGTVGGEIYLRQELIETSLVSVPANPNALAVAKALHISSETQDLVFAKHGNRDTVKHRSLTAKHGDTSSRERKGSVMSLAQRIIDLQTYIGNKSAELDAHLANQDDSNVKETDLQKTTDLNAQLKQARQQHAALTEAERNIAGTVAANGGGNGDGRSRALATTAFTQEHREDLAAPIIVKSRKKDWEPLDYLVHAGVIALASKNWGIPPDAARTKIYGEDEPTKVVFDWAVRAPSAPALTTVAGWAQELVQQIYADLMALLFAKSVFPRLSAKGLSLNFGAAGKIVLPTRSRTPTLAGSFVGEGMAIPVRQGAFTSTTYTPKKLAVITVWSREMSDHSIPAIEGVLRDAIQTDTAVALDSILLDANPATTIRPAGILNGVTVTTATAGGGVAAVVGDIKSLVGALTTNTYGNLRMPTWIMNPVDALAASLVTATNTGIFPFKDEIGRNTLANIPIIDSATLTPKTVILIDAADFVTFEGNQVRMELSDQATLHMEDSTPLDLVSGSPGTVASPQRSLFQTDSIALRMIAPLNWAIRRTGVLAWTQNVTW